MRRLPRLGTLALGFALVAGCNGHDPLAPRDIAGVWLSAWPQTTQITNVPDTLVLDSRGGGRIRARRWLDPLTPGGAPREVWAEGPVRWEIRGDSALFGWCMQVPGEPPPSCPDGQWALSGRMHRDDGMLWIGPTSPVSSLSALPWKRRRELGLD